MNNENTKEQKATRTRCWTFLVYPESAPENWRYILDDLHLEWIESPLHDKDVNPDGTLKKAHYHVMIAFTNVKSFEQVREITESLNCPIPIRVQNGRAMVRYMAHLDNPEKHQYPISEIYGHGGVDVSEFLKPNSSERYTLIKEMSNYIRDNDIIEFFDFYNYAMDFRFDDWFPLLCDNSAFVIDRLIKSNRHRIRSASKQVNYDSHTGEIYE